MPKVFKNIRLYQVCLFGPIFIPMERKHRLEYLLDIMSLIKKFITKKDLSALNINGMAAVYFPHSYAIAGVVLLVEKSKIIDRND